MQMVSSKSIFCLVTAIKPGQMLSQVASLETPRTQNNKHEDPVEVRFCQGEKKATINTSLQKKRRRFFAETLMI